jgi:LPXTG-motif cell wall-anchored protein
VVLLRGVLVALVLGLIMLVGVPAASAADYPPGSPGVGAPNRPVPSEPSASLPRTGGDLFDELGIGAGLVVAGGAILIATRRRRGLHG